MNKFPTPDSVENFVYNGFSVRPLKGFAKYKVVKLLTWTKDPGIGRFSCSDGIERLIPSCCLSQDFLKDLPKAEDLNVFEGKGMLFGIPSHS
jgi:hypothetical protein